MAVNLSVISVSNESFYCVQMNPLCKLYVEPYGKNYQADNDALNKQGVFLHEHARPLNKQFAWRLTTGSAFMKMARLKAIIEIICSLILANVLVISQNVYLRFQIIFFSYRY